jgi:hypothetical protein
MEEGGMYAYLQFEASERLSGGSEAGRNSDYLCFIKFATHSNRIKV